ncbi:alpha/beta hydrolase [Cellulomonas shaoxiangyii]|uniref:Alpha/beta hydrolase n=1 Tax=Cellulomonas shaoxiangyii TaxID=2566013 RepID=A0A4V1CMN4_9CELL|nr:alpha/beta hydrolase [Cellulomonas shaoxiangyii]QCB93555.1 alpha/beta hydrolase [Cellulomonas shaoxiangyii]TGY86877.1 alpha/beta hydrolase [Cellulomonas shaoxiangyii]
MHERAATSDAGAAAPPDGIETFRAGARRHAEQAPRALDHLPRGTYERVPLPGDAPVRELMVYRPSGGPDRPGVFVNLHGGGFVLGDWEGDDPYCRHLADTAGCTVVNVDYLLAPEHPFPAAVHQVTDLLAWLGAGASVFGADGTRLAVGGHSAGGNLAAAACLLAARRGQPGPRGLVVDYAPLDLATAPAGKLAAGAAPEAVELAQIGARFNAWYLPSPAAGADELASPVRARDLSVLPPTLVLTAEHDLLRADGDRFADRLRAAGVDTEHAVHPGSGHAFTHVGPEDQAAAAWQRMADFLRRVLGGDPCA